MSGYYPGGPQYPEQYPEQPPAGPQHGPGRPHRVTNQHLGITTTVLTVIGVVGLVLAITAPSSGTHKNALDGPSRTVASVSFPSTPTVTSATGTSTGTSPGTSGSSSGSSSATSDTHTCALPSGATSQAGLKPPDLLDSGLSYSGTLSTPVLRYTLDSGGTTLSSYCFDNVKQTDLDGLLAYCGGAGWTATPTKSNQLSLSRTDTLLPKHVFITVTGTLVLKQTDYDDNTGSVEVDWY